MMIHTNFFFIRLVFYDDLSAFEDLFWPFNNNCGYNMAPIGSPKNI